MAKRKKWSDLSEHERRRQRQRARMRSRPWGIAYRRRIAGGLEKCRNCGAVSDLRFAHLVPHLASGKLVFDNTTILCEPCNAEQGTEVWPHLVSLRAEEAAAPPEQQWSRLVMEEMRPRNRTGNG